MDRLDKVKVQDHDAILPSSDTPPAPQGSSVGRRQSLPRTCCLVSPGRGCQHHVYSSEPAKQVIENVLQIHEAGYSQSHEIPRRTNAEAF